MPNSVKQARYSPVASVRKPPRSKGKKAEARLLWREITNSEPRVMQGFVAISFLRGAGPPKDARLGMNLLRAGKRDFMPTGICCVEPSLLSDPVASKLSAGHGGR